MNLLDKMRNNPAGWRIVDIQGYAGSMAFTMNRLPAVRIGRFLISQT